MPTRLLLAVAGALLLAACGTDAASTGPVAGEDGASGAPAGSWVLVDAQPAIDVPDDARVTLEVSAEGDAWQVGGTAACNSYGGTVVTEGGAWRSQGYGGTDMGCAAPRMAAEEAYHEALGAVEQWARPSPDELVLSGPDVELRYEALPAVPTAELTATTWVLDGLVSGTGPEASVSSPAAGADEATLRLDTDPTDGADGTVAASSGCRTFSGEWVETGDEILLTTFGVDEDSPNVADDHTTTCDEAVVEQERHVLSVLGDGFRAEIEGQRLTLISRDGLGLSYRTAEE